MFGSVVKRESPEKNPANSIRVKASVRLNPTRNLKRGRGKGWSLVSHDLAVIASRLLCVLGTVF